MTKQPKNKTIAIFEGSEIRRHWDEKMEIWYFAVSDVIAVLTKSVNPTAYWRKLKERLLKEGGNETVTKCHALKMLAPDGKMRLTDAADTQTILRLIQSIPSPNAEPFKLWLARVGYERLEETATTEISQKREPKDLSENKQVAQEGGSVAGNARKEIESKTGKRIVTNSNAKSLRAKNVKKLK